MKIGVHLPQWGVDATRDGVLSVARAAEDAGLDSVWVADHLVHPVHTASTYPYQSGGTPFKAEDGFLEAFTLLATVAGATSIEAGVTAPRPPGSRKRGRGRRRGPQRRGGPPDGAPPSGSADGTADPNAA